MAGASKMSCHVPAAVLINLDGHRLSCHHWTPVDVVAIWSLCGFYMASQCCPPFTETAQMTWIHRQWDPLAGACSSDVRCPGTLRAPSPARCCLQPHWLCSAPHTDSAHTDDHTEGLPKLSNVVSQDLLSPGFSKPTNTWHPAGRAF